MKCQTFMIGVNCACFLVPVWLGFLTSPFSRTPMWVSGDNTDSKTTKPSVTHNGTHTEELTTTLLVTTFIHHMKGVLDTEVTIPCSLRLK